MANSFHDQLVATRDKKHSKNHPFFELWAQGKLTKEQTAFYCTQHYHFVGEFLNWLAYLASQIPERDVKNYLYENLGDEENPDDRHLDMLKDYVAASGVDRNSVESSIVLGGTEQLQNWGWMMVYQKFWPVAAAGLFIGLESQFLDICKKIVPALHQHYGYQAHARDIRFFEEHIYADEIHGSKGFAIVEKYCTTPELQAAAIKQVEDATIRRWRYMNNIYWYALHGKEDDTPAIAG
jgi:pyrroloquinoline quinone (PQQ) biosynthesis protein C